LCLWLRRLSLSKPSKPLPLSELVEGNGDILRFDGLSDWQRRQDDGTEGGPIVFAGSKAPSGAYVLRIRVVTDLWVRFGRYAGGAHIAVPAGAYAYVGSALALRGSTALAPRLLRHATRSGDQPPHAIRADLLAACERAGLPAAGLPRRKKLFWNIDYLLDDLGVEIISVLAVRASQNLESYLARGLLAEPGVAPLAPRLGAHDSHDVAHLLRIPAQAGWWRQFVAQVTKAAQAAQDESCAIEKNP